MPDFYSLLPGEPVHDQCPAAGNTARAAAEDWTSGASAQLIADVAATTQDLDLPGTAPPRRRGGVEPTLREEFWIHDYDTGETTGWTAFCRVEVVREPRPHGGYRVTFEATVRLALNGKDPGASGFPVPGDGFQKA